MSKDNERKSLSEVLGRIAATATAKQQAEAQANSAAKARMSDNAEAKKRLQQLIDKHVRGSINDIVSSLNKSNLNASFDTDPQTIEAVECDGPAYRVNPSLMIAFDHQHMPGRRCKIAVGDQADTFGGILNVCAWNDVPMRNRRIEFVCVRRFVVGSVSGLLEGSEGDAKAEIDSALASALERAMSVR